MAATPYKRTEAHAKEVVKLKGFGLTHDEVADVLDISKSTLRRHYKEELRRGSAKRKARVINNLVRLAEGHPAEYDEDGNMVRPYEPPNVSAAIFAAKTLGGLVEVRRTELTGKEGKPVETEAKVAFRFTGLDPEDAKV